MIIDENEGNLRLLTLPFDACLIACDDRGLDKKVIFS